MAGSAKLSEFRWTRILIGGILAELVLFAIVFPVQHVFGQQAFLVSIVTGSFAMPLLFALWVCRRADVHLPLHGSLTGLVAALFYMIIAWGQPEPTLYKIAHGLKIVGGWVGGNLAARRASR